MDRRQARFLVTNTIVAAALATACGSDTIVHDTEVLVTDDRPAIRSAVPPPPISGGTLIVTTDSLAIAADPDRDTIHIVDLFEQREVHTIELDSGEEPGRVVEDADGYVHVVLRRSGQVMRFDPQDPSDATRRGVCPNPRGIAFDASDDLVVVGCAGGDLVSLPAAGGAETARIPLLTDLRDVVATDDGIYVSRFRSAQLLRVDSDGGSWPVNLPRFPGEPALLHRVNMATHDTWTIEMSGPSRRDTGHEVFHLATAAGIACASCHPEGSDDGRVWEFLELGSRRTQPLNVGLEGTEPFHWEGDMSDVSELMNEVHHRRMGALPQSKDRMEAIEDWLFSVRPPNPVRVMGDEASVRGRALFLGLGCESCHSGPSFTNNETIDDLYGGLQVPNLRGVAMHPPFMHDGRSLTLADAITQMVSISAPGTTLDSNQSADLQAYLETL